MSYDTPWWQFDVRSRFEPGGGDFPPTQPLRPGTSITRGDITTPWGPPPPWDFTPPPPMQVNPNPEPMPFRMPMEQAFSDPGIVRERGVPTTPSDPGMNARIYDLPEMRNFMDLLNQGRPLQNPPPNEEAQPFQPEMPLYELPPIFPEMYNPNRIDPENVAQFGGDLTPVSFQSGNVDEAWSEPPLLPNADMPEPTPSPTTTPYPSNIGGNPFGDFPVDVWGFAQTGPPSQNEFVTPAQDIEDISNPLGYYPPYIGPTDVQTGEPPPIDVALEQPPAIPDIQLEQEDYAGAPTTTSVPVARAQPVIPQSGMTWDAGGNIYGDPRKPGLLEQLRQPTNYQNVGKMAGNLADELRQPTNYQNLGKLTKPITDVAGRVGDFAGKVGESISNFAGSVFDPNTGYYDSDYLRSIGYTPGQGEGSMFPGELGSGRATPIEEAETPRSETTGYGSTLSQGTWGPNVFTNVGGVGGAGGSFYGGRGSPTVVGGGAFQNQGGMGILPNAWQSAIGGAPWMRRKPMTAEEWAAATSFSNYQGNALAGASWLPGMAPTNAPQAPYGNNYNQYLSQWTQVHDLIAKVAAARASQQSGTERLRAVGPGVSGPGGAGRPPTKPV